MKLANASHAGKTVILAALWLMLAACTPKVGSDAWCDHMEEKSKGDWSANEAKDYASHCIFKSSG